MQLSNAVDEILCDVLYWIEQNKERGAWVMINFPSKFLHTAKLLVSTSEFDCYSKVRFLKARNLSFDFKDGELTKVQFNLSPGEYMSNSVSTLNNIIAHSLHRLNVTGLPDKYVTRRGAVTISQPRFEGFASSKEKDGPLLNLEKLKNFKFATT